MQLIRKHTAIVKMHGRSNYSRLARVFASISSGVDERAAH
jgi:hypothetical protein